MTFTPQDYQQMGRMAGQIDGLERDRDDIKSELKEVNQSLKSIEGYISENRGGWKLLLGVIGIASSVSSVITFIATWLKFRT